MIEENNYNRKERTSGYNLERTIFRLEQFTQDRIKRRRQGESEIKEQKRESKGGKKKRLKAITTTTTPTPTSHLISNTNITFPTLTLL